MAPVSSAAFSLPPVDRREVLRYAGMPREPEELSPLLEEMLSLALPAITGKVCWLEYPICPQGETLDLGFARITSNALSRNLSGCTRVVVFGATVGLPLDRLITRYSRLSPARALLLQAIGAERIEALCDVFCQSLAQDAARRGLHTVPRFSPGYGDFPLSAQQDIFRVLDCSRSIGLTLNESLLMSPSKSVTAMVGLGPKPCTHRSAGCSSCSKNDCMYRRTTP